MSSGDRVHLLTEAVCNLVRAQEVVSNPASAVKELLDNAIDAGATSIHLNIVGSGKLGIHVIDDGCGMSPIDARMAFERHATSKIRHAEDLEHITTLGFRGEGLASIAAISRVELRTRRAEDELGTEVVIIGGDFQKQSQVVTPVGTSIHMTDIFFNVPGRRRSLKKDSIEERLIDTEFIQSALVHPHVAYRYSKGQKVFKELPATSLKERILAIAGRSLEKKLLPVNYQSPNVCITGFVSLPTEAVKVGARQYFFVNGRYIKHDYFRRAIELVFEPLVTVGHHPHYFIYFTVPTEHVDINIHPSKKEVRFLDEPYIFELLKSLIRESLSAHAAVPLIDFERPATIEIPAYVPGEVQAQETPRDVYAKRVFLGGGRGLSGRNHLPRPSGGQAVQSYDIDWDNLSEDFASRRREQTDDLFAAEATVHKLPGHLATEQVHHGVYHGEDYPSEGLMFYKGRYLLSTLGRNLVLIDYHRAHERVLYERYRIALADEQVETQPLMFPEVVDFSLEESAFAALVIEGLASCGFRIEPVAHAADSYQILEVPLAVGTTAPEILRRLVESYREEERQDALQITDHLALILAESNAYAYGRHLERSEVDRLMADLFASADPYYDPQGRRILSLIEEEEIDRRFA